MSSAAAALDATAPRIGYDPSAEATAARVLPMLSTERVVWLSTVHPDGTPHLVPTWFWWDGSAILCWSRPGAVKVRNLRANPRLMVAVGDPASDFSVGLIEAVAELVDVPVPPAFFGKYAADMVDGRLDPGAYPALYPQAIRITPTRFLAWRGRGTAHDAAPAPARGATRGEVTTAADRPGGRPAGWLATRLERASARLRGSALTPAGAPAG